MTILKTFSAGLSTWRDFFVNNWKKIVLGILIAPFALATLVGLELLLAAGFANLIQWTAAIPAWNEICNKHPRELVFGLSGGMVIFVILYSLYQDGKKKLSQESDITTNYICKPGHRLLCCENCKQISQHEFNSLTKLEGNIHRVGICPHCAEKFFTA